MITTITREIKLQTADPQAESAEGPFTVAVGCDGEGGGILPY